MQLPFSGFDPRPREGGDSLRGKNDVRRSVSIHAPARGATRNSHARRHTAIVSIHAPARGATFWEGSEAP